MHKGNFTLDAFNPPSNLEFIVNAQYVGVNNSQHLAPYVNFSFGITHPLGIGMLTLFETNAFNNQTALFSTVNGAQPQPLVGGGFLLVAANPLPPRTFPDFVLDQHRRAQRRGLRARRARRRFAASGRANGAGVGEPGPAGPGGGAFAFGELHFKAPPGGTSPLAVDTTRTECTAELQPLATTALAQLGAAAAAYAAGTTAAAGGDRRERDAARRSEGRLVLWPRPRHPARPARAPGGRPRCRRRRRPTRPAPARRPRCPGGAPPVFQSQITVAPNPTPTRRRARSSRPARP